MFDVEGTKQVNFQNEIQPAERIKDTIVSQIRETVQSLNLKNAKNQTTGQDSQILELFYLKEWSYSILVARDPQIQTRVSTWDPPPTGFLKLNFDGVVKGNLRGGRRRWSNKRQWRNNHSPICWEHRQFNK
jgi:hypothetical protein